MGLIFIADTEILITPNLPGTVHNGITKNDYITRAHVKGNQIGVASIINRWPAAKHVHNINMFYTPGCSTIYWKCMILCRYIYRPIIIIFLIHCAELSYYMILLAHNIMYALVTVRYCRSVSKAIISLCSSQFLMERIFSCAAHIIPDNFHIYDRICIIYIDRCGSCWETRRSLHIRA